MSVYVITGVSRGIGFGYLQLLHKDPNNLIVGLVRDKAATQAKVAAELGDIANIHILQADLDSYVSLKQAAAETAKIVGDRGVDYLIANGSYMPFFDAFDPIGVIAEKVDELEETVTTLFKTNVIGNIHLFSHFIPLVLQGTVKKVIFISSGHADLDLINDYDIDVGPLYSMAKAANNVLVAKYSAQYKKDGVLFLSISPGVVDVGNADKMTPEQLQAAGQMMAKFNAYSPGFKVMTPDESVRQIQATWEKASIQDGYGGKFISHLGNTRWI